MQPEHRPFRARSLVQERDRDVVGKGFEWDAGGDGNRPQQRSISILALTGGSALQPTDLTLTTLDTSDGQALDQFPLGEPSLTACLKAPVAYGARIVEPPHDESIDWTRSNFNHAEIARTLLSSQDAHGT